MESIASGTDFYELTKVPFLQKIGNMAISGVIYIAVAIVGVVIGVAGTTYTFEQTEIEPKIKEVAKKIGEGVENIQPETVKQVTAAITDLGKTGNDVVNAVISLSEGGDAQGGNVKGKNAEGDVEMSNMGEKAGLPLSVNSLTAATTGAGLSKITDLQNTGLGKVTDLQNTGLGKVTDLQNTGLDKVTSLQSTGLGKVTDLQNVGLGKVTDLQNVGLNKLGDTQSALQGQMNTATNLVGNTKAETQKGLDALKNQTLNRSRLNQSLSQGLSQRTGGGRKTKSKRTKLTNEPKVKKPRTKKCLIQKDNKMYMSFCI
jgi:hypothetical protein